MIAELRSILGAALILGASPALAQTPASPPAPSAEADQAEADALWTQGDAPRRALHDAVTALLPEADAIAVDLTLTEDERHERIVALLDRIPGEIEAVTAIMRAWGTVKARQEEMTPEQTAEALDYMERRLLRSLTRRLERNLYPSAADAAAAPDA